LYGTISSVSDPIEDLHRPLREKATRYGVPPHPYLVAVIDPIHEELDHEDVDSTLHGRTVDEFRLDMSGHPTRPRTYRGQDGF